jgi:hypothetical protein
MGVKFGEIDANQILENEFRINVLERIVSEIFTRNVGRLNLPTPQEVEGFRFEVIAQLQKKYPLSGVTYNPPAPVQR